MRRPVVSIVPIRFPWPAQVRRKRLTRVMALVKSRQAPFDAELLKPKAVVDRVRETHPGFSMSRFVNAWRKLRIRPSKGAEDPGETDTRYCYYDPVDKDYRYEPAFTDLICQHIAEGEAFTDDNPI